MFRDIEDEYKKEDATIKGWITHRYTKIAHRISNFFHNIVYFIQKITRSHHCSNLDLWDLYSHLAKITLPKLVAFRAQKINGYPNNFSEWSDNCGYTKEEYDKAKSDGSIVGGEMDAWLKTIDEMIFAFEFVLYFESWDKKKKQIFIDKYKLPDLEAKIPENLHISYEYSGAEDSEASYISSGEKLSSEEQAEKKYTFLGEDRFYHNYTLEEELQKRASKGFELFGKYFRSLWD